MPTAPLPQDPNLAQLRKQARELQQAVRRGDAAAQALVAEFLPAPPDASGFPLSAAQLVLARRYDFPSWPRLRRHVEIVTARSWAPPSSEPAPPDQPLADRFLRLACFTYSDESVADRQDAAMLLAEHPELTAANIFVAAACADAANVERFLARDPGFASTTGGPYSWSPLLYQACARHDPAIGSAATLETGRLRLEHRRCNRSSGARLGNALRGQRRAEARRRAADGQFFRSEVQSNNPALAACPP